MEEIILLSIWRLQDNAYGITILEEVKKANSTMPTTQSQSDPRVGKSATKCGQMTTRIFVTKLSLTLS